MQVFYFEFEMFSSIAEQDIDRFDDGRSGIGSTQNKWHYICVLVDLFNREIIGFSTGSQKNKELATRAFASVRGNLREIQMFHTDRGGEFANQLLDETLATFHINRSLSMKACPYDNAVAEATFKIIKTEVCAPKAF
jgi:transposase InsO family protein